MTQYHAIIVVKCYLSHELLAVVCSKVFLCWSKYACSWISFSKLFSYLRNSRLQSDNHRFLGNTHASHFHDSTLHYKSLTCTHNMVYNTTTVVDKHPNGIFLMRSQLFTHKSCNVEMRAIKLTQHSTIKLIIVQSHQHFLTLWVLTNPILKGCAQVLYLVIQQFGFLLVEDFCFLTTFFNGIKY